ncbi:MULTISPECIES: hypothetical protein, partial [unclassified Halomonas]|uniref:hypothetical protein n=1 Tax=unclassified Halomonas TaxID=2609666 RepID=UPI002076693E
LHVLSLPPAFNLSHDQTLQFKISVILACPTYEDVTQRRINLGSRFKRIYRDTLKGIAVFVCLDIR